MNKLNELAIIIGFALIGCGFYLQVDSRKIASSVLHMNVHSVNYDELYAMQFSTIGIGLIVFFLGCCVLFFEYALYRIEKNKESRNSISCNK